MEYLHFKEDILREKGALHTAREIDGQPLIWKKTAAKFYKEASSINDFLNSAFEQVTNIILTGAGTSAFIGLSLHGVFFKTTGIISSAVSTTDIVSHPQHYFSASQIPLIISFARSGNSPESCAALELADKFLRKCFHLVITCDNEGALANYTSLNPVHVFTLPPEANDKSLAMTGSYTSMLLTGLLTAYRHHIQFCNAQIENICNAGENILQHRTHQLQHIAGKQFQRAVFLGSGALFGTATEAALKLQELTDGQIICKADSFLGFRHGPKAVIDDTTLVVYFFSNNEYVQQYETDLVYAMKKGNSAMFQLGVSEQNMRTIHIDEQVIFSSGKHFVSEDFLPVCNVLPAQLIGFYKSVQLGLMPDAPSVSGAISRVVQGVNIYPVEM